MNNRLIDHTLLKAFATTDDIKTLCAEAKEFHFKSVCVNPAFVKIAATLLANTDTEVCTVIGFPLGANSIATKVFETQDSILSGATEIDMVINIGKAKEHDFAYIEQEISEVVMAAQGKLVKVIMETCYLADEEKIAVCQAATKAKANFVKTSTGFGTGGATVSDVKLMRKHIASNMEVKASGGIKTKDDLEQMVQAGATRIGTSAGKNLV
ncbi:MAG: deoxyribose-phosphate aldolase [Bacilli bacterium]|nr:deoxyribose-phosphate aldolase [Bacilli bacterium]